jgi:hypothetical protein
MDSLGFIALLAMIGGFFIGASPVIKIGAPDANQCQHVDISRFWGTVTIVDAVMCPGDEFKFDGETLRQSIEE